MTYIFDEEDSLGKAVQDVKPFCKLTMNMDIPTEKQIVGDFADPVTYPGLAGRKWSRLCGFTFKSNNGQYFQFVFVPKLKGTLSRNQKALSGWYCWTLFSKDADNKQVTSINEMQKKFGFDINKFVHSDLFDKYVDLFKKNLSYVAQNQLKTLLEQPQDSFQDYPELVRYVNAVKDSIAKIDEVKRYVTPQTKYNDSNAPSYAQGSAPKVGHAKIAYNADKTYDLRNDAKASQQKELKRRAVEKLIGKMNAEKNDSSEEKSSKDDTAKKTFVKYDPSLKNRVDDQAATSDDEIFDKYDDYDNDDFR